MEKYSLVPQQLLYEGTCTPENFFEPDTPDHEDILAVHDKDYFNRLISLELTKQEIRKIGFPLSKELVDRELKITQGTIDGAIFALEYGIAMNIAGGTHHAYTNRGEGFCMLNDQAIAARYLLKKFAKDNGRKNLKGQPSARAKEHDQDLISKSEAMSVSSFLHNDAFYSEGAIEKILIVDLDVHQGNGTAEIFQDDATVFTFSMHGAGNYPFRKEKSNLDIALPDGTEDEAYLSQLKETLPALIASEKPDFIFYLSGVDILQTDKLGRLGCTLAGCKERDRFVLQTCKENNIPVQISMGGGYSPDIKTIIEAHSNTFRLAQEIFF